MSKQGTNQKQLSSYELRDFISRARELVESGKSTIVKVPEMQIIKVVGDDNRALDELYDLPYGVGYVAVFKDGGVGLMKEDDWTEWDGPHGLGTKLELIDEFLASHPRLAERWTEIYERLRQAVEAEGLIPTDPLIHADVETQGQITGRNDGRLSVLFNGEAQYPIIDRFRHEGGETIEQELSDEFGVAFTW